MGHHRAHLLGAQLGGSNTNPLNFITMYAYANTPVMRGFEGKVRRAVEAGQTVRYTVTPVYEGTDVIPIGVTIDAVGSNGFSLSVSVVNRRR